MNNKINYFARIHFGLEQNIEPNHPISLLYRLIHEDKIKITVYSNDVIKEVLKCFLKIVNKFDVSIVEKRKGLIVFSNESQIKYKKLKQNRKENGYLNRVR